MSKRRRVLRRGPLKGKTIEMAATAGIEMYAEIAEDFMAHVFGFEPGEYLITDESSLHDFVGVDDLELAEIHRKIREAYAVDVSDLESGTLV
ncbi:MAG: hypothetical protein HYY76_06905 [Acidobacteria bacterium]|nr:hypothetical protein [Acidobacteriota bacterium]